MTPEEICDQETCMGCSACMNVCAHRAITMQADKEGFLHPTINEHVCVDCGMCQKTCPIRHIPELHTAIQAYSGWSSSETVRLSSSSGGAFTEIARPVIEAGGVVFGCGLDDKLQAVHMYVEDMKSLAEKLSGSKYVQSRIGNTYQQAKVFLKSGRKVLFSGTPCQIAGLRNFLRKDYDNLITVDLICHGVPSPLIFEDYKRYMEQTKGFKITDVKFRCKKSSWIFFNMTLTGHVEKNTKEKSYYGAYYEDPYIRGFLRDYFLRPSCHRCRFTSTDRCSDFTIADWWGYKKVSVRDNNFRFKGVSLILANTEKAMSLTNGLKLQLRKRTIKEAMETNGSLSHPYPPPSAQDGFLERLPFPYFWRCGSKIHGSRKSTMEHPATPTSSEYRRFHRTRQNSDASAKSYPQSNKNIIIL